MPTKLGLQHFWIANWYKIFKAVQINGALWRERIGLFYMERAVYSCLFIYLNGQFVIQHLNTI